jgi:hypothetical protein
MRWKGPVIGWALGTLVAVGLAVLTVRLFGLCDAGAVLIGFAFGGIMGPVGLFVGARRMT